MPSNNSKYSPEFRDQTAKHIIETGKSATSMAEELSIDINTVCRWVREYRKKHGLPSWHEEQNRRTSNRPARKDDEIFWKYKDLEREFKKQRKLIAILEEEKSILKKSLVIYAQPHA
jgi:transposase-like protein